MKPSLPIFVAVVILLTIPSATCSKAAPETVEDILSQAADVSLVKYDCVWTWPNRTQTSRVWIKDNMMRIEHTQGGQTVETYLCDYEEMTSFHWTSPENTPKRSVTPGEVGDFFSAMYMASIAAEYNPKIIGTETTDEKECYLIEYVMDNEIRVRAWIWKKHKILVRNDLVTTDHTVTIEFKNIDFSSISDSMFELPKVR
ncbi:MAG TPA: outer membrane lipoprotein-sorting protein [Dehalococcoidia bacterium]|nr:outer membrane lipoprotein-sorting protein [Dehalococcoidia bacterium]